MNKPSIEEYLNHIGGNLPRRGFGWRKMICPFHEDTHASAAVNFDKDLFKCHGCDVKGDTYTLIMNQERISFIEAIKFAQAVLTTGNYDVLKGHRSGGGVPKPSISNGRRSRYLSSGSG